MKNEFNKHLKIFNGLNVYFWIGGAAIYDFFSANKPNDIDVFFRSEKDLQKAINLLKRKGFRILFKRNVGALLESRDGVKYDLLNVCKSPEHLFNNFNDFTICCAAIDSNGIFWHHEEYFDHCDKKELHYIENRVNTDAVKQKRLKKFVSRGFTISSQNLIKWLEKLDYDKKTLKKRPQEIKKIFHKKLEKINFKTIKTKLKD
jgi:hypothetical protein